MPAGGAYGKEKRLCSKGGARTLDQRTDSSHHPMGFIEGLPVIAGIAAFALAARIPSFTKKGRAGTDIALVFLTGFLLALPLFILSIDLLFGTGAFRYSQQVLESGLPWKYRISGLWSTRVGPLVLWATIIGLLGCWQIHSNDSSQGMVAIPLLLLSGGMMIVAARFEPLSPAMGTAAYGSMNPLLQTDLMVIHPPLIFVGYSVALLLASKALVLDWSDPRTSDSLRKSANLTLIILTIGIGLGGLWAFMVLDWGGYWAWDPVETGSLLPWILVLLLLHVRTVPQLSQKPALEAAIAGSTGCAVLLAALVTRAGGVWASVHAFVGNGPQMANSNGLTRILLAGQDPISGSEIGFEIGMLTILANGMVLRVIHWQTGNKMGLNRQMEVAAFFLVLLIAPIAFSNNPSQSLFFLIVILALPWIASKEALSCLFWRIYSRKHVLTGFALVLSTLSFGAFLNIDAGAWGFGVDPLIGLISCSLLLWWGSNEGVLPHFAPTLSLVSIHIIAAWAGLAGLGASSIILGGVLYPWLMGQELNEPPPVNHTAPMARLWFLLEKTSIKAPIFLGSLYFFITLISLFTSMDSPRFDLHETLGAPILFFICIFLFIRFGVTGTASKKRGIFSIFGVVSITLVGLLFLSSSLPGDSEDLLIGPFIRGHIAWLILPASLFVLPTLIAHLIRTSRNEYHFGIRSLIQKIGPHIAHVGMVLFIIGHVFSTTLVARGALNHVVTLTKDVPLEVDGRSLTFTGIEVIPDESPSFDERFDVGEGYVGVMVKVDGESDLLQPGVIRFDRPNGLISTRSEVARSSDVMGTTVVVLDSEQASELMRSSMFGEDVERVRLTVYSLPFNWMIWGGWLLLIVGMAPRLLGEPPK